MDMIKRSVLDSWIKRKHFDDLSWNRRELDYWQLKCIQETVRRARTSSPFYRRLYHGFPLPESLEDFRKLPTIDSEEIKSEGHRMLCVSQKEISRVVTLATSGTSGEPKRLFFTAEDQELTIDFFNHGMRELVSAGEKTAVCLPFQTPGCVGDLLIKGLERQRGEGIGVGIIDSLKAAAEQIITCGAQVAVGVPVQLLGLAEYAAAQGLYLPLKRVLTSTEGLPCAVQRRLEMLGIEVFDHFGMTECGLGVAIECGAHRGMHIRENDLFMEILDPNGDPLPDGQFGELAVTTLTRRGMPLIRYRTGDRARFLPGGCGCGSILRRLEMGGRLDQEQFMGSSIEELDEFFFSIGWVIDYRIGQKEGNWYLEVYSLEEVPDKVRQDITARLAGEKVAVSYRRITDCLPAYSGKRKIMREE